MIIEEILALITAVCFCLILLSSLSRIYKTKDEIEEEKWENLANEYRPSKIIEGENFTNKMFISKKQCNESINFIEMQDQALAYFNNQSKLIQKENKKWTCTYCGQDNEKERTCCQYCGAK